MRKVYFEDNGQDFLWWLINHEGVVVEAGPFQSHLWEGNVTNPPEDIEIGDKIPVYNGTDHFMLKHRVARIEEIKTNQIHT